MNAELGNNKIHYFNGTEWKDIEFADGLYSYSDISNYIGETLALKGDNNEAISVEFDSSSFKCKLIIQENYGLDLRNSKFCYLIGFEPEVVR